MADPATRTTEAAKPSKVRALKQKQPKRKRSTRTSTKPNQPKHYRASLICRPTNLPAEFVAAVRTLEKHLDARVLLLVQPCSGGDGPLDNLDGRLLTALRTHRRNLPAEKPIVILVHSPGGSAQAAFEIASTVRKRCGSFTAVVPRYAKSAATLLTLGAQRIIVGRYGELGPLDVQITESYRKGHQSALNERQTINQLHASALKAVDETILFLMGRLGLQVAELDDFLEVVFQSVGNEFRPLFEKVEVVHWSYISRLLKIGQDYAVRLLRDKYGPDRARQIASALVEAYPDHSFVIDAEEAQRIGLDIELPPADLEEAFEKLYDLLDDKITAVGFLETTA